MVYSVLVLDLERDVVESNDRTWSKVIYAGDAIFLAPGFLTSSQPYLHMDIYVCAYGYGLSGYILYLFFLVS